MKWISAVAGMFVFFAASPLWSQECEVAAVSVNFGVVDSLFAAPLDSTGEISVACDSPIPYIVKLGPGESGANPSDYRRMGAESHSPH